MPVKVGLEFGVIVGLNDVDAHVLQYIARCASPIFRPAKIVLTLEGAVHSRTPVFLRFAAELPSVEARGRWRERGGCLPGADSCAFWAGDAPIAASVLKLGGRRAQISSTSFGLSGGLGARNRQDRGSWRAWPRRSPVRQDRAVRRQLAGCRRPARRPARRAHPAQVQRTRAIRPAGSSVRRLARGGHRAPPRWFDRIGPCCSSVTT